MQHFRSASNILLINILALLGACSETSNEQQLSGALPYAYETYEHQGIQLNHPDYWTLKFDEAPDFSDDRAIVFDASELSRITLHIRKKPGESPLTIADQYVQRLGLKTDESIESYQRKTLTLGGHKGERLSWRETKMFPRKVQVTILRVQDSPFDTFIVFDLDEEDIEKESPNILRVIESIKIQ